MIQIIKTRMAKIVIKARVIFFKIKHLNKL